MNTKTIIRVSGMAYTFNPVIPAAGRLKLEDYEFQGQPKIHSETISQIQRPNKQKENDRRKTANGC